MMGKFRRGRLLPGQQVAGSLAKTDRPGNHRLRRSRSPYARSQSRLSANTTIKPIQDFLLNGKGSQLKTLYANEGCAALAVGLGDLATDPRGALLARLELDDMQAIVDDGAVVEKFEMGSDGFGLELFV